MAYVISPQGFVATGINFANPTAGLLKRVGLIRLSGNGCEFVGSYRVTPL